MVSPFFAFPLLQDNDPRSQSVADSLGFTQSVAANVDWQRAFEDFLDLLQTDRRAERGVKVAVGGPRSTCRGEVVLGGPSYYPCSPNQETIPASRVAISGTDALGLLDAISGGKFKLASIAHALGLTDAVLAARQVDVSHAMSMSQTIAADLVKVVSDVLAVTQTIGVNHDSVVQLAQALGLVQAISSKATINLSVADGLALAQLVTLVRQLNVSHAMFLVQAIQRVQPASLSHALALAEQIVFDKRNQNGVVLNLAQVVGCQLVANRSMSDALGLKQAVAAVKVGAGGNPCSETYAPAVPLGSRGNFVLTYPYAGPTLTVALRNPKFGNVDTVDLNLVVRNNRGGDYKFARPASWQNVEVLKFNFEGLDDQQKQDLITFVGTSAGFEVGLLDQDARQWRGVVVTQVQSLVQSLKDCAWATTLEFRGKLA